MKHLSEKKKELLREFVSHKCEQCHRHERIVGKLTPHRIHRGYLGGEYNLRNIKMLYNYNGKIDNKISCSKSYHWGEFK